MKEENRNDENLLSELSELRKKFAEFKESESGQTGVKEESKSSEEWFRIVFEYAPDAYYLNDLEGKFIDGNRAAERISGYKKEEIIGKSFLELNLLPDSELPKAAALLARNIQGEPTGPDELIFNQKDGTKITLEIKTFPIKINGETLVLGIARDITPRIQRDEELENIKNESEKTMESDTSDLLDINELLRHEIKENERAKGEAKK